MKKPIVQPGSAVSFFIRHKDMVEEAVSLQYAAVVQQVCPGALVVPEFNAGNGLAHIVCNGASESKGRYWYEYRDKKGQGVSNDVTALFTIEGVQIMGAYFFK